jgi:hypothetical protein
MGAAAVIILRKQRDIVEVYQGARAITPDSARTPDELGIDRSLIFKGLVRRAVLRETSNGRFYLDQPSWNALHSSRRRIGLVVAVAALAALALITLRLFP